MPLAPQGELDRTGISDRANSNHFPPPPSFLHIALRYAQIGWHIIPLHHMEGPICSCRHPDCQPGKINEKSIAKHPRLPRWQKDATRDIATIEKWWTEWPHANIGIATGAISNLLVLDIDCHRDKPGFLSLQKLETELGPLPRTRTARTGSGGQHRLFLYPQGLAIANAAGWRGAAGIDWRGNGGQIVVAPSVTPAGMYQWTDPSPPAELPSTWIDAHAAYEIARRTRLSPLHTKPTGISSRDPLTAEDHIVLHHVNEAANAEKFHYLWKGTWQNNYESQSNADLALCSILAFWCDPDQESPDPDRIDRIFRHSGLYREKWERDDYRNRTILFAVDKEETRRASERELRELITGQTSAASPSTPFCNSVIPLTTTPTFTSSSSSSDAIDNKQVFAEIRKLVRKKRCSKFIQNKIDADLIENFMAAEQLISSTEIKNSPSFSKYDGQAGLQRVAWILGQSLKIPWDAIINSRSRSGRVYQKSDEIETMKNTYQKSQAQKEKIQQERDLKKTVEKQEKIKKIDLFYKTNHRVVR